MAKQRDNTAEKKPLPKEIGKKMPPERSIFDDEWSLFSVDKDLVFPYSIQTFEAMGKDTTLASALNAVQTIALRVPRYIEPYDESDTHKKRAKFVDVS